MQRRQHLMHPGENEVRYDLPMFKEKPSIRIFWRKVSNLNGFNQLKTF